MIHLVCTLGDSPLPVLIAALSVRQQHPDAEIRVHMMTSKQARQRSESAHGRLRNLLLTKNFAVGENRDPHDVGVGFAKAYKKFDALLMRISPPGSQASVIVDITGGTKVMSLAAFHAAQSKGDAVQYIDGVSGCIHRLSIMGQPRRQSYSYTLANLGVTLEDWCRLTKNAVPYALNDKSAPNWLKHWAKDNDAQVINVREQITFRWEGLDYPLDLKLFVRLLDTRLQAVVGLKESDWKALINGKGATGKKSLLSETRLVRRVARHMLGLGSDFVDGYLIFPEPSQGGFNNLAPLHDAIQQAESLGLKAGTLDGANHALPRDLSQAVRAPAAVVGDAYSSLPLASPDDPRVSFALVSLIGDEALPTITGWCYHLQEHSYQIIDRLYLATTEQKRSVAFELWRYFQLQGMNIEGRLIFFR